MLVQLLVISGLSGMMVQEEQVENVRAVLVKVLLRSY